MTDQAWTQDSWWYAPLDKSGPAPADPDSATKINNVNAWLGKYNTASKAFVQRFLYLPNGGNSMPIYYGASSDPVVDWAKGTPTLKLHTPRNAPKPGTTGSGTRNGHMVLYDFTTGIVMGTGYDGWASEIFDLKSKGIQQGLFEGTKPNDGPRGRSAWLISLQMKEFKDTGGFAHRIGMGWVDGDKQFRTNFGTGPNAFRTKQFAWPLSGNDGGGIYSVEGQVFRIKAAVNIDVLTWKDPIAKAVAHTMQTYGAVVIDGEGPYTGGPIIDQYAGKSLEVVNNIPITPNSWEWVKAGYDPRNGSTH